MFNKNRNILREVSNMSNDDDNVKQPPQKQRRKDISKVCTITCLWNNCNFEARILPSQYDTFSTHLQNHCNEFIASLQKEAVSLIDGDEEFSISYSCLWENCPWEGCDDFVELSRHIMLHGYHRMLCMIGENQVKHLELPLCAVEVDHIYQPISALNFPFLCEWECCTLEFVCPNQFYRHVEMHLGEDLILSPKKSKVLCKWQGCCKQFRDKHKLKDHIRVHTRERVIGCSNCGVLFSNKTKLIDHLSRQNEKAYENFQCSHCLKRYPSERLLRDHMRHHVNYLKCPHCDMTCPNPGSLKYHITYRHSDHRPYPCQMCDQRFKSASDLSRHEESHLDKGYVCTVIGCDYSTKTSHCMNRHMRIIHSDEGRKQYACHICPRMYSRGFGLTKHLKKEHNFSWPSGHPRFRYIEYEDGYYRLQMVRFESAELTERLQAQRSLSESTPTEMDFNAIQQQINLQPSSENTEKTEDQVALINDNTVKLEETFLPSMQANEAHIGNAENTLRTVYTVIDNHSIVNTTSALDTPTFLIVPSQAMDSEAYTKLLAQKACNQTLETSSNTPSSATGHLTNCLNLPAILQPVSSTEEVDEDTDLPVVFTQKTLSNEKSDIEEENKLVSDNNQRNELTDAQNSKDATYFHYNNLNKTEDSHLSSFDRRLNSENTNHTETVYQQESNYEQSLRLNNQTVTHISNQHPTDLNHSTDKETDISDAGANQQTLENDQSINLQVSDTLQVANQHRISLDLAVNIITDQTMQSPRAVQSPITVHVPITVQVPNTVQDPNKNLDQSVSNSLGTASTLQAPYQFENIGDTVKSEANDAVTLNQSTDQTETIPSLFPSSSNDSNDRTRLAQLISSLKENLTESSTICQHIQTPSPHQSHTPVEIHGGVQPSITIHEGMQPSINTHEEVRPSITTDERVQPSIATYVGVQPSITIHEGVRPSINTHEGVQNIEARMMANSNLLHIYNLLQEQSQSQMNSNDSNERSRDMQSMNVSSVHSNNNGNNVVPFKDGSRLVHVERDNHIESENERKASEALLALNLPCK